MRSSKPYLHPTPLYTPQWRSASSAPRPPAACSSGAEPAAANNSARGAPDAAAVIATAVHHAATAALDAAAPGSIRIRDATPGDACALAALDARCAACGSSGWSEALYRVGRGWAGAGLDNWGGLGQGRVGGGEALYRVGKGGLEGAGQVGWVGAGVAGLGWAGAGMGLGC